MSEVKADRVQNALLEAGAPFVTREDMGRLYKGRIAEVLDFCTSSLVGRQTVAFARDEIQTYREQSGTTVSSSRAEIDTLYTRLQRAEARVKNAHIVFQQSEEQLKKSNVLLTQIESEADASQKELEDKRLTTLLLSVLERKEAIRKERVKDVLRLLNELRSKVREQDTIRAEANASLSAQITPAKPMRAEYTRDALASLQSHTIRLARFSYLADDKTLPARTNDAEARLLTAIAHSMGSNTDDPDVIAAYEKALSTAHLRARASVEYRSPLSQAESGENPQDVSQRIIRKERDLQDLADEASALTLACVRTVQMDTVFIQETAPQLKCALEEEAGAAQGHVDALRRSIANRLRSPRASYTDSLSSGRSFEQTLSDIERQFTSTTCTESFLEAADALISPDPAASDAHAAMAASYTDEEAALSSRLQKLLQRKAAKADVGHALVEDIERLIAEVGIIAGTHT